MAAARATLVAPMSSPFAVTLLPAVSARRTVRPIVLVLCTALLIVTYVPALSLWLPHLLAR